VKDENGDQLADSHNILNGWKNYFSRLLNVRNVSDVRQTEVHTAEPLVPGLSLLEVEIAIAKLKRYKSPGSDQILAKLIQAGGEILLSAIHKLISSVWNKEELPDQWKESIIISVAIAKLKRYKSTGSDQILAKLIQAGGEILLSAIHKLINSVWNKEELPGQWKESIIISVHKKG
jgi:hypothetical protein